MDIYLTDIETKDSMRFPMLPERITVQAGGIFQSYSIMSAGEVKLPTGERLTGFSWDGILPGNARKYNPYVVGWRNPVEIKEVQDAVEWKDPKEIQSLWSVFRVKEKRLHLLVTETPINHDVYLDSYTIDYKHGYGDYYYKISFVHAKELKVGVSATGSAPSPAARRPEAATAKTHTVVSGDTLWGIAQKLYGKGSDYGKIYSANSGLIEETAKKRGRKDSDGGRWIYPGTVLTIP